ncbi:MFS transporter [Nocardioides sp. MAH-18]|uniref:MFS transporter n=1 Tax=Nocardioides agri TaxID=2682843 RepID=A0A6L6XKT5_9ACTN|nr:MULTISPECIES: MFS transporter [unclassified Nocardioides]MBA2956576.1 MFS transporter [Nocardioides sp. CGMCC 1.13656]MVQ47720.1 MFS transporter [Nocardioides sp. MAH-18]
MTDISFRRGPLAVLLTGTFLIVLDFFVVNVALPSVQRDLHADNTALEWLVAGYGLTFGGLLLVASRVADRWGRRRVFMLGTALFVASSAACGLAPDTTTLVVARLVQGAAAAAIAPTVLALIGDVYAGPHRARALGAYATVMGVAAASGQLIGGVLIHLDLAGSGWRAIFLVNVPIGLAAVAAAPRLLPETRIAGAPRVDVAEAALVVAALTALVLPLIEGQRQGWPLWTWASLVGSVLLADLAWLRGRALRRRGVRPLVDPDALGARGVRAGLAGQALLFTGMAAYFLVLALYLQDGRGLGPLASGAVFTIVAAAYMVGTADAAPLIARYGARATIAGAAATFGLGHLLLLGAVEHVGVGGSVLWLAPGLAVGGLGMGVALAALVGTVMGSVASEHAGTVSGTASTGQQVGNALGVALVGIVFFGRIDQGMVEAFGASLVYLVATTAAVAVAAALLPGHTRVRQPETLPSSSSAAA